MNTCIIQGRWQLLNLYADEFCPFVSTFIVMTNDLHRIYFIDMFHISISRLSGCFTPRQILLSRCDAN